MSDAADEFDEQLATAIHELIHALGFSSSSWPLFRNADGSPMTPRGDDGAPLSTSYTCPTDGVTRTVQEREP